MLSLLNLNWHLLTWKESYEFQVYNPEVIKTEKQSSSDVGVQNWNLELGVNENSVEFTVLCVLLAQKFD